MAAFDKKLRDVIAPQLKIWGFDARGLLFWRHSHKRLQVIKFQQNKYNNADWKEFTADLYSLSRREPIDYPGVREHLTSAKPPYPGQLRGNFVLRIGHLTECRSDYWYGYAPAEPHQLDRMADLVLKDIEEFALPWLERPTSPELFGYGAVRKVLAAISPVFVPRDQPGDKSRLLEIEAKRQLHLESKAKG